MVNNKSFMPAPATYARESDGKDTLKNVKINVLIALFLKISEKISYLCSADGAVCHVALKEFEIR